MLAEILKTAVEFRGKVPQPDRQPGLSCSSLFPCSYRLYLVHTGEYWNENLSGQELLNLEDGWDQEEQSIRRLKKEAGITIENRQAKVTVGRSSIPGSIDGTVALREKMLWEHKAWGSSRYEWFLFRGIEGYLGEKAQINAYMLGMSLGKCDFFVKKKESNDYHDIVVPLNKSFILPIIEWADRIRLDNWIPEPKLTGLCSHCGIKCFGDIIDLSWIKEAKAPEVAEKWRQGKILSNVGDFMQEEARTFFVGPRDESAKGLIGEEDVMLVEGLKIQKIVQHRFTVQKGLILKEFGIEGLMKVGIEEDVVQYRIKEAK